MGRFPYPSWANVFDQLKTVVEGEPPRIPADSGLSDNFVAFVHRRYVRLSVCMYVCMCACYVCMYVVCMYVCIYVCMYVYKTYYYVHSLTHAVDRRPKFRDLVEDQFIKFIEAEEVDVAGWYTTVREKEQLRLQPKS